MNDVTLRRLLVFGVCAVAVGCLYLVPGVARAPHQASGPRPQDEPTARRSSPLASGTATPTPSTTSVQDTAAAEEPTAEDSPAPRRPVPTGATAFDPADPADGVAPAPVTGITSAAVTPTRLTLNWPAASDNVAVVGYRVLLNGYEVATTAETHATVRWFNDDARDHVVQVRALDAAGNESVTSPNLLVARPTPAPSPSPTPTTVTPDPEQTPEPVPSPTPPPSPSPSPSETSGPESEPSLAAVPGVQSPSGTR